MFDSTVVHLPMAVRRGADDGRQRRSAHVQGTVGLHPRRRWRLAPHLRQRHVSSLSLSRMGYDANSQDWILSNWCCYCCYWFWWRVKRGIIPIENPWINLDNKFLFFFFINWQQGGFLTFMHIAHGADETRLAKHPHRGHIASASAALLGASALLVRFESHDVAWRHWRSHSSSSAVGWRERRFRASAQTQPQAIQSRQSRIKVNKSKLFH